MRDVLCEMDRRGQKTGAGFYDYDEKRNAKPVAGHREDHQGLRGQGGRRRRARSPTRRSSSAASIR